MKVLIDGDEIGISSCGSFCEICKHLIDETKKSFRCKKFSEILQDDYYLSRPMRCDNCLISTKDYSPIRNIWF